ncbi:MAG TPA: response regulator [bacterium]|nr:response regulator [bacterium]
MATILEVSKKTVEVLMVEDHAADSFFMRQALKNSRHPIHVEMITDGETALEYLRRQAGRGSLPDLILLDLSLPGKDGREVLAEIKVDPRLENIPLVVVSGSSNASDVLDSRELESDFYLVKPLNMLEFPALPRVVDRILEGRAKG